MLTTEAALMVEAEADRDHLRQHRVRGTGAKHGEQFYLMKRKNFHRLKPL